MPLTSEVLKKYMNRKFIETGTNNGLGVQLALDTGFEDVYSIEFYDELWKICIEKFNGNARVHLHKGDSGEKINDILGIIDEPATFWLDSHFSTSRFYNVPLVDSCPVLRELEAIGKHPVKTHTILIDDIRYFRCGIPLWNQITLDKILEKIYLINKDYSVTYEESTEGKEDILVATIK